jgi:asparagine synthase (glutamine-hydrolysing)
MCGIAGIIAKGAANPAAVKAMINSIAHRGPDGEGVWTSGDGAVSFGHRRLAIIDPTPAGAQPMEDTSRRYVITFNGEIYNYVELAARLEGMGVVFRSKSDTEVLLESYKKWGERCVDELNGMFAFAIYDKDSGKVFCGRDRFGEKPFLYVETPEFFAFASEYKALFTLKGVDAAINETALLRFLHQPRQGLDDNRSTVFPAINQLLPAETLSLDLRTLSTTVIKYWDVSPDDSVRDISKRNAVDRFKGLLTDSVKIRMRSDVPVGSCLSGGLDSSSIVCINRDILGDASNYHTFTGSFPGTDADEEEFAEVVRQSTGVIGHTVVPTAEQFEDDLPDFMWFNELPVGSTSQFAQWSVFRLAKENNVTVLLDGQGADELLGGYEQYFVQYLHALAKTASPEEVVSQQTQIARRYPMALSNSTGGLMSRLPASARRQLANWTGRGSDFLFGLSGDASNQVSLANRRNLDRRFNALSQVLKDDSLCAHLPTLLRYGDRNSMAHSREVRLPFCDHRLAEFVLSLSPSILMGNTETKHLLRAAMDGVLPDQINRRWNKQGFLPPQGGWFRGTLLHMLRDTLSSADFKARGYWNVSWWSKVLARFEAGEEHLAWTLWRPMIAEAWQQNFVKRINNAPRVNAVL